MKPEDMKAAAMKYLSEIIQPFDALIEKIGFENLCALAEEFGGGYIYIPTSRNMFKDCLKSALINEFDGFNYRALAKKYDFSVISVKRFVKL